MVPRKIPCGSSTERGYHSGLWTVVAQVAKTEEKSGRK